MAARVPSCSSTKRRTCTRRPPRGRCGTSHDAAARVIRTAEACSTVRLYRAPSAADCTPANLLASDTAAALASPGIAVVLRYLRPGTTGCVVLLVFFYQLIICNYLKIIFFSRFNFFAAD